jgi:secondary thiamine-phosphate synthase enzyme
MKRLAQQRTELQLQTSGPQLMEITSLVADWLRTIGAIDGLLTLFLRHTSASLTIQENADPNVRKDLLDALDRLAPEAASYRHREEGPDDMPAHVISMLTSVSVSVPVFLGQLALGTWQGIFLIEHRRQPQDRSVVLQYVGSLA